MKKFLNFALTMLASIFCISTFTSCAALPKFIPEFDNENKDQLLDQVLSAIQNEDRGYLKSLFSKKALSEVDDFDSGVQRLFDFFDGDVISYEFHAEGISDKKNDGIRTTKKRWWYTVNTNTGEYLFFFLEYPRDEENPDNVGLYMLQVIKLEDRTTLFDGGQTILSPGVYVPSEYFEGK